MHDKGLNANVAMSQELKDLSNDPPANCSAGPHTQDDMFTWKVRPYSCTPVLVEGEPTPPFPHPPPCIYRFSCLRHLIPGREGLCTLAKKGNQFQPVL